MRQPDIFKNYKKNVYLGRRNMIFGAIRNISLSHIQPPKIVVASHFNMKREQESGITSLLFNDMLN